MLGPYVSLQTAMAGFFAFAAVYLAVLWCLARRDVSLLLFAGHSVLLTAHSVVLAMLLTSGSVADAQWAMDWRNALSFLSGITLVWLLVRVSGVRARAFAWAMTAFFTVMALVSLALPLAGAVTSVQAGTAPWGEAIVVTTRGPASPWFRPAATVLGSIYAFGLYCAWVLARRDRVGALLMSAAMLPYLAYMGVLMQGAANAPRWLYLGAVPYAIWAMIFAIQLAREQRQKTEALRTAEAGMRDSEARYRFLVNNQPETVVEWHPDGRALFVNDTFRRVFGFERESTDAIDVPSCFDEPSREAIATQIGSLTTICPQVEGEYRRRHADGQHWHQWTTKGIFDEAGRLRALQSTGRDVTDRKRSEATRLQLELQLARAQQLETVGMLAGGIAHDFNNLVTIITGYSELLMTSPPGTARSAELLEIRRAGERAATLTQQILAFSGRNKAERIVFDANTVIREAERMLRRVIGADITLDVRTSLTPAWIAADPGHLERVLLNLVINARDAMPQGGTLVVGSDVRAGADASSGSVCLLVRDDGTGMTPDVRRRLFEPFFTTKAPGKGTGLGLAVVDGFAREYGAQVDVESEVGRGTTFRFTLPLAQPEAESTPPIAVKGPHPTGTETVLVVDDDAAVRSLVKAALTRLGYVVLVASSGEEALRRSDDHPGPIDLVISDVVMPGMGAAAAILALREGHPRLKVLYMTGYSSDEAERRGIVEPDAFLGKPFSLDALQTRVRDALDGSRNFSF